MRALLSAAAALMFGLLAAPLYAQQPAAPVRPDTTSAARQPPVSSDCPMPVAHNRGEHDSMPTARMDSGVAMHMPTARPTCAGTTVAADSTRKRSAVPKPKR